MAREWLTEAWLRVKALVKRKTLERDLDEELQFHLAMRAEKNRALGSGANDAKAAARKRFGSVTLVKEDCRETWTFTWFETLWQDAGSTHRFTNHTFSSRKCILAAVMVSIWLGRW